MTHVLHTKLFWKFSLLTFKFKLISEAENTNNVVRMNFGHIELRSSSSPLPTFHKLSPSARVTKNKRKNTQSLIRVPQQENKKFKIAPWLNQQNKCFAKQTTNSVFIKLCFAHYLFFLPPRSFLFLLLAVTISDNFGGKGVRREEKIRSNGGLGSPECAKTVRNNLDERKIHNLPRILK